MLIGTASDTPEFRTGCTTRRAPGFGISLFRRCNKNRWLRSLARQRGRSECRGGAARTSAKLGAKSRTRAQGRPATFRPMRAGGASPLRGSLRAPLGGPPAGGPAAGSPVVLPLFVTGRAARRPAPASGPPARRRCRRSPAQCSCTAGPRPSGQGRPAPGAATVGRHLGAVPPAGAPRAARSTCRPLALASAADAPAAIPSTTRSQGAARRAAPALGRRPCVGAELCPPPPTAAGPRQWFGQACAPRNDRRSPLGRPHTCRASSPSLDDRLSLTALRAGTPVRIPRDRVGIPPASVAFASSRAWRVTRYGPPDDALRGTAPSSACGRRWRLWLRLSTASGRGPAPVAIHWRLRRGRRPVLGAFPWPRTWSFGRLELRSPHGMRRHNHAHIPAPTACAYVRSALGACAPRSARGWASAARTRSPRDRASDGRRPPLGSWPCPRLAAPDLVRLARRVMSPASRSLIAPWLC